MDTVEHNVDKEKVSVPVGRPEAIQDEELLEKQDDEDEWMGEVPRRWYVY